MYPFFYTYGCFFYCTTEIQQNIYFYAITLDGFTVQLRKDKAWGLIASGYRAQSNLHCKEGALDPG